MQAIFSDSRNPCYTPAMAGGRPAKHKRTAFGERLYSLRVELGISQAQLADKIGVTQQAYAGWERSTTALRPEDIAKIADALDVSADELLGRKPQTKRGTGPTGKTRRVFDSVSPLPRHQQKKVVETIETLLAGIQAKAS